MELTTKIVELRTLTAGEGMYLTQAAENAGERVFAKSVNLAKGELETSWREATEEEKIAHEAKVKAELEAMAANPGAVDEETESYEVVE